MISTRFKDLRMDAWALARFWAGAPSATPQKPASGGQGPSGADLSVAEPKGTDGRRGSMAVDVEQVVRNAYQVAERRDVPGWVSLFADDGVFIDESIGVTYKGPNELGKTVEVYGTAFPDMHRELYDFWTAGNTVIVRLALQGTHNGPLATPFGVLPATGKRMDAPCTDIWEIEDGKIKKFDCYPEGTIIFAQLGVLANLQAALTPADGGFMMSAVVGGCVPRRRRR